MTQNNWDPFWKTILEDAPVNNVGGHMIAGTFGDPPKRVKRQALTFPVSESAFESIKSGKENVGDNLTESVKTAVGKIKDDEYFGVSHPRTGEKIYIKPSQIGIGRRIIGSSLQ